MRIRVALIAALFALAVGPAVALAVDPAQPAFGGPLTGAQEVPPVATAATGEGTAVISPDGSTITYIVTYSGLSGPAVAAHIHIGATGVAGPVILPLAVGPSPMVGTLTAADVPPGSSTTFAEDVAAIQAGNTYFNIHTAAHPGGEIRGQIVAKGKAEFASLAGFQEVPPVTTSGTGNGWVLVSTDLSTLTYYVAYSGLSGPAVAAHIHIGATGVAGPVILPLAVGPSPMVGTLTAADVPPGSSTTFAEDVAAIQAGNTYFNIHTAAHPGGEIRGQIGVTVAAPAPSTSPSPSASPSASAAASSTLPATATSPAGPATSDPTVPAVMALLVFMGVALAAGRTLDRRRGR